MCEKVHEVPPNWYKVLIAKAFGSFMVFNSTNRKMSMDMKTAIMNTSCHTKP